MWTLVLLATCVVLGSAQIGPGLPPRGPPMPTTTSPPTDSEEDTQSYPDTYFALMAKIMRPGQPFDISMTYNYYGPSDDRATVTVEIRETDDPYTLIKSEAFLMPPAPVDCVDSDEPCPVSAILSIQAPENSELTRNQYNVTIGGGLDNSTFFNSTSVTVKRKVNSVYIQTDRAIYKPGSKVRFRVVSLDSNLRPVNTPVNISIHDPMDNKIKQWRNVVPETGVISNQLELSEDPPLGYWSVRVSSETTGENKAFQVDEYVLPKFEVNVNLPSFLLTNMESFAGYVEAKYTYGQPVKGHCDISVQIKPYGYWDRNEYGRVQYSEKALVNGKAEFDIPSAQMETLVTNTYRYYRDNPLDALNYRELLVSADCTETLTGKTISKNGTVMVRQDKFMLSFMSITPNTFKPGLEYPVYLKLSLTDNSDPDPSDYTYPNGTAMTIDIRERQYYYYYRNQEDQPPANWTVEIGPGGLAATSFMVPSNRTNLDLTATFREGEKVYNAYRYVQPFKSRDNQAISVSLPFSTGELKKGEDATFRIKTSETTTRAYIQLLSKSRLAYSAVVKSEVATQQIDHVIMLSDELAQKLAPKGRAIVYYTTSNDEIISDSIDFNVDGAFANEVTTEFNATEARPGNSVSLTVTAHRDSFVGILAIDQSSLLLASGNDFSQDQVIDELNSYDSTNLYDDYFWGGPFGRKKRRSICFWCPFSTGGQDTSEVFDNAGSIVLTDGYIYVEPPPLPWYMRTTVPPMPMMTFPAATNWGTASIAASRAPTTLPAMTTTMLFDFDPESSQQAGGSFGPGGLANVERVRTTFPETWIWADDVAGADGKVNIVSQVPDTITSWVTTAFAVSDDVGFGLSSGPAMMTVFKPFFVSLTLPYNMKRNEETEIQLNVFNYLPQNQSVLLTLERSDHFGVKRPNEIDFRHAKVEATLVIPSGDAKNLNLWIKPTTLGQIPIEVKAQSFEASDAVKRILLVEAEGAPQEYTYNQLINLNEVSQYQDVVSLELPSEGLVPGSARITASLIGDLMGPALSNLDHLIRMPSGCGEQNMLNFVPNIVAVKYMDATGVSDTELRLKAVGFMEKGYQRELNYMRSDGSFSAFGNSDPSGSTWLTAFVLKSFCQSRDFIDVDADNIVRGTNWILDQQTEDGHFLEPGRVIHYDMQGGAAAGISMTAYITTMLLDACYLDTQEDLQTRVDDSIASAIGYLLAEYDAGKYSNDAYTLAIVSYALAKQDHSRAEELMIQLDTLMIMNEGMQHWSKQPEKSTELEERVYEDFVVFVPPRKTAPASEIETTSYGLLTYISNNKFTDGIPVMKWLVSQRSSLGGYSSTQDTVMALEALAEYGVLASGDGAPNVVVALKADDMEFAFPSAVTDRNRLLLQKIDITEAMGKDLELMAFGSGIALLQVTVEYNIETVYDEVGMNLEVTSQRIKDGLVQVDVCAWYTGDEPSGMVGLELSPLSGYVATNLDDLRNSVPSLSRVETAGTKYMFYFDEMVGTDVCFTLYMERANRVQNVQKALVTLYRYYNPDVRRTGFYLPRDLLENEECGEKCDNGEDLDIVFIDETAIVDIGSGNVVPGGPGTPQRPPNVVYGGHSTRVPPNINGVSRAIPGGLGGILCTALMTVRAGQCGL